MKLKNLVYVAAGIYLVLGYVGTPTLIGWFLILSGGFETASKIAKKLFGGVVSKSLKAVVTVANATAAAAEKAQNLTEKEDENK